MADTTTNNNGNNSAPNIGSGDRLGFTIFLALALHALIILGITFKTDLLKQAAPVLHITLATHNSKKAPEEADFIAQHNQQASGTKDTVQELTTQRQADFEDTQIRDTQQAPQVQASSAKPNPSQEIVTATQSRRQWQEQPQQKPDQTEPTEGKPVEQAASSSEIASLQARLSQQRQQYAKRPRLRHLTSVSTKSAHDAEYLRQWADKVEQVGNRNFPQAALLDQLYGSLRLAVTLQASGGIVDIDLLESSGHTVLDEAALQIVRLAAPYRPFPPEIRKNTDQLEIIRTWHFKINGLSTK